LQIPPEIATLKNLQFISLANNQLTSLPPAVLHHSKLNRMQLQGNHFSKESLQKMEGFSTFEKRRKARVDKEIAGGLTAKVSLCGFD